MAWQDAWREPGTVKMYPEIYEQVLEIEDIAPDASKLWTALASLESLVREARSAHRRVARMRALCDKMIDLQIDLTKHNACLSAHGVLLDRGLLHPTRPFTPDPWARLGEARMAQSTVGRRSRHYAMNDFCCAELATYLAQVKPELTNWVEHRNRVTEARKSWAPPAGSAPSEGPRTEAS